MMGNDDELVRRHAGNTHQRKVAIVLREIPLRTSRRRRSRWSPCWDRRSSGPPEGSVAVTRLRTAHPVLDIAWTQYEDASAVTVTGGYSSPTVAPSLNRDTRQVGHTGSFILKTAWIPPAFPSSRLPVERDSVIFTINERTSGSFERRPPVARRRSFVSDGQRSQIVNGAEPKRTKSKSDQEENRRAANEQNTSGCRCGTPVATETCKHCGKHGHCQSGDITAGPQL